MRLKSKQEEGREPSEPILGASPSSCRAGIEGAGSILACRVAGGWGSRFCAPAGSIQSAAVSFTGPAKFSCAVRSALLSFLTGSASGTAEFLVTWGILEASVFGGGKYLAWFPPFSATGTGSCFKAFTPEETLSGSGFSMFKT